VVCGVVLCWVAQALNVIKKVAAVAVMAIIERDFAFILFTSTFIFLRAAFFI
jgi:hypothetical protein